MHRTDQQWRRPKLIAQPYAQHPSTLAQVHHLPQCHGFRAQASVPLQCGRTIFRHGHVRRRPRPKPAMLLRTRSRARTPNNTHQHHGSKTTHAHASECTAPRIQAEAGNYRCTPCVLPPMGTMHITLADFPTMPTPAWLPLPQAAPCRREHTPRREHTLLREHTLRPGEPTAARDTLPLLQAKDKPLRIVDDPASRTFSDSNAKPAATAFDPARAAEQEGMKRLVLLCLSGDTGAWQELVHTQHRRIYGICYRFTGSQTDAEDLTQDVFLKLYRSLSSFDPGKGAFSTWLTTLTRNLLVDHFRRTRQDRSTDSLDISLGHDDGDGPTRAEQLPDTRRTQHDQLAGAQLRAHIQHALRQLSPELREAVILRDLQDLDYKEIAAILRVPEGTVKSRISRGRGELARILGRDGLHAAGDVRSPARNLAQGGTRA